MAVRGEGLAEDDAGAGAEGGSSAPAPAPSQSVVYVLHPNCAIEEV